MDLLLHELLRTTTVLSNGAVVEIEIANIDFVAPVGDDVGGRVTAEVTATIPALEPEIVATRFFDRKVYDGEPDDAHLDETDWQAWYGDDEMIDHQLQLQFESRVSGAVSEAIGRLEPLREGCLSEDEIEAAFSKRDLDARLTVDFSDCGRWRLDVTTQRGDKYWTDGHQFVSLRAVAQFIATIPLVDAD